MLVRVIMMVIIVNIVRFVILVMVVFEAVEHCGNSYSTPERILINMAVKLRSPWESFVTHSVPFFRG